MLVFPYCCSFCLHSGCFPSSLMMKFKLSPKRREISGSGKYKDSVMEQTETLLSALLRSQPWPHDAQTCCKCSVCTFGLSPNALVFILFPHWWMREQMWFREVRKLCCNHHQNSFAQESFSCSMWLLLQPSSEMHLKYMDNSEKSENS